ncbi:hypothetical protein GCM10020331_056950 [Ectobacillus funiculus]
MQPMEKKAKKLVPGSFFLSLFLFNFGTALVVSLGLQAKKDAWLAILFLEQQAGSFWIYRSLFFGYIHNNRLSAIFKRF